MSLFLEIRRRGRHILGPTFGIALLTYFMVHSFQGDRGLLAYVQLRKQVDQAEQTLLRSSAERAALEHRISLLRSDHLDPDLLDERVRAMTGLGRPGDKIILLEPQNRGR